MYKGQKLSTPEGVQVLLYPQLYLNISQGVGESPTHMGRLAIDMIGQGVGRDDAYASCDCTVAWKDTKSGHGILFQSDRKVLLADRTIDYAKWVMWHDDDISNIQVGMRFAQGDVIYQEGVAGHATGPHIHFNISKGRYTGGYPLVKNSFGVWEIKNEIHPAKMLYINGSKVLKDKGYNWQAYTCEIVEGDKVKVIGDYWANGVKIPWWVKLNTYTVIETTVGQVLLGGVRSWAYRKDVVKV
jgi:hypothetical protein